MSYNHFLNTVIKPEQDILLGEVDKMFRYMGVEDADIQVEAAPMLDSDIIIAEDVPQEEVVEEKEQTPIAPNSGNPMMEDLKSRLMNGIPKNMQ